MHGLAVGSTSEAGFCSAECAVPLSSWVCCVLLLRLRLQTMVKVLPRWLMQSIANERTFGWVLLWVAAVVSVLILILQIQTSV